MRITFIGTRGYIVLDVPRHHWHSSLMVEEGGFRLLIDHGCQAPALTQLAPDAIVITHAHPDTFKWLKEAEHSDIPVYVTKNTKALAEHEANFRQMEPGKWLALGPFHILPYPVVHSLRAPAVGFKIKNKHTLLYNSDVVVPEDKGVLEGVDIYIGDASSVKSDLVRRKDNRLFGHTRIQTQINWCKEYGIKRLYFTHWGEEAIREGKRALERRFQEPDMDITFAYDGMEVTL